MATPRSVVRMLAIPAMAAGMMVASAGPASANDGLLKVVQEVTGTVIHAESGLTAATGNVTGIAESVVFELGQTIRAILSPAQP